MVRYEVLDSFLFYASEACCSPFAVFIQIQGCLICLILATGWALAAYVRNREIRRMKKTMKDGNTFAFICQDINELEHSSQMTLPRVSVVMPLKGFGEHNLRNWRSQITSLYGGPLEFLFVVESIEDPAYDAVSMLISDFKDDIDVQIVVAGLSTTCSQKIHNQLVGVEKMHKDSKYVLFLDDDVRLHPGTVGALTAEMEKNPDIFIQTGYPLDLPSGTIGSYCIYEYHMPCSMGFATGGRTFFLWGGCMMMHADDFRNDLYGMVTGLRDGGYSDDMTLAAIAGQHKRLITSPPVAVFPHPLASDLTFPRYWNYLRKQTFVLESYISRVNWIMNRALFTVHFYLSWGFVAPYFMATIHIAAALRLYSRDYNSSEIITTRGLQLAGFLAISTIIELLSMWNLTKVEIQLCNHLSPEEPPVSLGSYNWVLIFIAMLVDNFLYPISAIQSHFSQCINWSGVRYHLKNGKINKKEGLCFKVFGFRRKTPLWKQGSSTQKLIPQFFDKKFGATAPIQETRCLTRFKKKFGLPSSFKQLGETDRPLAVRERMFGRAWPYRAPVREGFVPTWPQLINSNNLPCTDDEDANAWLNNVAVRKTLHARPTGKPYLGPLASSDGTMIKFHKNLTARGYRALIFRG